MISLRSVVCKFMAGVALLSCFSLTAAETVSISGAVLQPGQYQLKPQARLRDAAVAGQVRADAWPLGAALLRESAMQPQQRLKAGLLFDLRVNKLHARANNDPVLHELVERLDAFITPLPVTGRVTTELNPFQLLIQRNNHLLEAGDQLVYPTRPDTIKVLGAVAADCQLTFDATLKLKDYLRQCPAHPAADPSHVYLIQPDGTVNKTGIAHWNQQDATLAVGAIIYRALDPADISPDTADLNRDMADFLATQYTLGGRFSD